MRLAAFILRDMEPILAQWETFATTLLPAAANLESLALRDHAQQILHAVAKDLRTSQTREAQREKSLGRGPSLIDATETAAQTHALLRARAGFNINQIAAAYRALRASVLRLWMDDCEPEAPDLDDVIRFNEAIDQALAESVTFFSEQVEQNRNRHCQVVGSGRVRWRDEEIEITLSRSPLPSRCHQLRRALVLPVPVELARHRGTALRARCDRDI
jgi:hypothetical protein